MSAAGNNRRMTYRDSQHVRTFVYCPEHAPSPAVLRPSVRDPFTILSDEPTGDACTLACSPQLDVILP